MLHRYLRMVMNGKTLEELARHVGGRVAGDPKVKISSVAPLNLAGPGQITFLANSRYAKKLAATKASAVVVAEPVKNAVAQIVASNPYFAFTQIVVLLHGHRRHKLSGVSAKASIDSTATIGKGTNVHDFVTISERVNIGRHCVIYPGVFIGPDVEIGDDCVIYPNVAIYDGTCIGNRVIIQANATIGEDGFGFATEKGVHHKIPHVRRVILEDDVEIGSNSAVERGSLVDTIIGRGTKVGDLVAIGHGVQTGPGCLIVAQAGIAGSTTLGRYCVVAGQAGIAGHLKIGDHVTMAGQSGVAGDLANGEKVFGTPAFEMRKALRAYQLIKSLPEFRSELMQLEKRLAALEATSAPRTKSAKSKKRV